MVLLTAVVGAGAPMVGQSSSLDQFQSDTTESQKLSYIEENFTTGQENTTSVQLIVRGDDVLSKDSLLDILSMEQSLRDNETVNQSLVANNSIVGIPNIVAQAAISQERAATLQARQQVLNATTAELRGTLTTLARNPTASPDAAFDRVRANTSVEFTDEDAATFERAAQQVRTAETEQNRTVAYRLGTRGVLEDQYAALRAEFQTLQQGLSPTLAEQRAQIESMNESELDRTLASLLSQDGGQSQAFAFMPKSYEPGTTTAEATMVIITQQSEGTTSAGASSDRLVTTQLAMEDIAQQSIEDGEVLVFGGGIISDEITRSMSDSLAIVGPLALLFVVVALTIAYRDVLDILLGVLGIAATLVWTFGFMGWAGIDFNQIFVAVPVLLIGLSIDYAIHIFMRHREERHNRHTASDPRGAMRVAIGGVGIALIWVTATTVIGFLSNLTSPVPPIQDFGVVSAVGIVATMLVFGVLIPAVKVELDEFLEGRGWDRKKTAFGTGGGAFSSVLSAGSTAARKAPYVVILLALVVSAGGAYGATQVDTSFNQEDFLADEPPGWTESLPEPFKPGEYSAKANLDYVDENFGRESSQAQILVQGSITDPGALDRVAAAQRNASDKRVVQTLSNGDADIQSPVGVMQQVAATNETFNATFTDADTDGDGVPDENLTAVYDGLFAVAPDQAEGIIHRTDGGEYEALRLVVSISGGASGDAVTTQMRDIAADIGGNGLEATATGQPILFKIVQDQLLQTVIESLIITLVAVFAFLMLTYRITEGSATLGAFTLLPVVLSVSWILGTMALVGIPFNILTGMITSLTVGLGVAYSIHLSERYNQELERADSMWEAMQTAVTGTGGALLGSAATTVGGFGVLAFAILPPLQQFGIITGLTIIYAFLASVLVLPSLLVVWTRWFGPNETPTGPDADTDAAAVAED
jgi:predicted RND superfamily exporter protein